VKRLNPSALVVSDLVAMASWGGIAETMEWVDFGVLSPHKVGGPVGVGVVLRRRSAEITPLLIGGAQEYDMRAGTVSVPLVVAGVEALSAATRLSTDHRLICESLQARLEQGLTDLDSNVVIVGAHEARVGITSAVFAGLRAEDILFLLDEQGVCASAGAACASGAMQPSHVLLALGYPREEALSQVRFSYAPSLSEAEIDYAIEAVGKTVKKLRFG
jgi:cysteine desulfurase